MTRETDILILGSGIAGLSLALKCADNFNVTIICKSQALESNTRYAQGGIASVVDKSDHFDSHIQDTLIAGNYLCDEDVVRNVVTHGPRLINDLLKWGVKFSKLTSQQFELGIEGGHSKRRVLHANDITGYEIAVKLLAKVKKHPRITLIENTLAIDLITHKHLKKSFMSQACHGAYVMNRFDHRIEAIVAKATVLATGGAGKTYLYTSNPDIATGDGIAMAYRAGADIANLEFVQFHPTCLFHSQAKSFLISEALRGEGAFLRTQDGERFMKKYHKLEELAPRDIVARAIDGELKKSGHKYVTLDISHKPATTIKKRFPNIYKVCKSFGYDLTKAPLPVVPAAHYFCGGVLVNTKAETTLPQLYAIGEVSCTGLHGANRLASNSLLEGLAYADFCAQHLKSMQKHPKMNKSNVKKWNIGKATNSDEAVVITQNWDEIRRLMWNYVGIVRTTKRLERASHRIDLLNAEVKDYYWDSLLTPDLVELRNIIQVADLMVQGALNRKESIGLHTTLDYPQPAQKSKKFNILRKDHRT